MTGVGSIRLRAGMLEMRAASVGPPRPIYSVPFSPSAHRYWRLRETGGYLTWETSSDGVGWTQQVTAPSGFDATSVFVRVGQHLTLPLASPSSFGFDNFGIAP